MAAPHHGLPLPVPQWDQEVIGRLVRRAHAMRAVRLATITQAGGGKDGAARATRALLAAAFQGACKTPHASMMSRVVSAGARAWCMSLAWLDPAFVVRAAGCRVPLQSSARLCRPSTWPSGVQGFDAAWNALGLPTALTPSPADPAPSPFALLDAVWALVDAKGRGFVLTADFVAFGRAALSVPLAPCPLTMVAGVVPRELPTGPSPSALAPHPSLSASAGYTGACQSPTLGHFAPLQEGGAAGAAVLPVAWAIRHVVPLVQQLACLFVEVTVGHNMLRTRRAVLATAMRPGATASKAGAVEVPGPAPAPAGAGRDWGTFAVRDLASHWDVPTGP
jgi:hypothetical protein